MSHAQSSKRHFISRPNVGLVGMVSPCSQLPVLETQTTREAANVDVAMRLEVSKQGVYRLF